MIFHLGWLPHHYLTTTISATTKKPGRSQWQWQGTRNVMRFRVESVTFLVGSQQSFTTRRLYWSNRRWYVTVIFTVFYVITHFTARRCYISLSSSLVYHRPAFTPFKLRKCTFLTVQWRIKNSKWSPVVDIHPLMTMLYWSCSIIRCLNAASST